MLVPNSKPAPLTPLARATREISALRGMLQHFDNAYSKSTCDRVDDTVDRTLTKRQRLVCEILQGTIERGLTFLREAEEKPPDPGKAPRGFTTFMDFAWIAKVSFFEFLEGGGRAVPGVVAPPGENEQAPSTSGPKSLKRRSAMAKEPRPEGSEEPSMELQTRIGEAAPALGASLPVIVWPPGATTTAKGLSLAEEVSCAAWACAGMAELLIFMPRRFDEYGVPWAAA